MNAAVLAELRRLAREARPYELCGLLRAVDRGSGVDVVAARVLPNRARDPAQSFRLSADDVARTRAAWAGDRDATLGVFHTHGTCDATPSAHDVNTMRRLPGVHMIVGARGDVRVFECGRDGLSERRLAGRRP